MKKKEILNKVINFRISEKMYESLLKYLKDTDKSISRIIREATYDYLRLKELIKKIDYKESDLKQKESC